MSTKKFDIVYIVAGGPSLKDFDWKSLKYKDVIAINNAAFKLPYAKYVYFANRDWFLRHEVELMLHAGRCIAGSDNVERPWVDYRPFKTYEGIRGGGGNSGYAAIGLAIELDYRRIRLLGYDMHSPGSNFHNDHTWTAHKPDEWIPMFNRLAALLDKEGIEVINLTPGSALTCFAKKEGAH